MSEEWQGVTSLLIGLVAGYAFAQILLLFFQHEIFSAIDRIVEIVRSILGLK